MCGTASDSVLSFCQWLPGRSYRGRDSLHPHSSVLAHPFPSCSHPTWRGVWDISAAAPTHFQDPQGKLAGVGVLSPSLTDCTKTGLSPLTVSPKPFSSRWITTHLCTRPEERAAHRGGEEHKETQARRQSKSFSQIITEYSVEWGQHSTGKI